MRTPRVTERAFVCGRGRGQGRLTPFKFLPIYTSNLMYKLTMDDEFYSNGTWSGSNDFLNFGNRDPLLTSELLNGDKLSKANAVRIT